MISFAYPWLLLLLLLPPLVRAVLPPLKGLHGDALRLPFLQDIEKISVKSGALWSLGSLNKNNKVSAAWLGLYAVWTLLCLAAARPQWSGEPIRLPQQARDILMVMDISNSMLERDFAYNGRRISRLNAVKLVARDFVNKRADDRLGLILFGSRAYLQAPITFDKAAVVSILMQMDAGMAGDSTAIGDALGLALKSVRNSGDAKEKVVILLTDGENNDGSISIPQAVKLARDENVKIYTVGVGAPDAFFSSFMGIQLPGSRSGLDEKGLEALAQATRGRYFRAENTADLQKVYQTIDRLEPTEHEDQFVAEVRDLYYVPLLAALGLALLLAWKKRRSV